MTRLLTSSSLVISNTLDDVFMIIASLIGICDTVLISIRSTWGRLMVENDDSNNFNGRDVISVTVAGIGAVIGINI